MRCIYTFSLLFFAALLHAQPLPYEMRLSADQHRLRTGGNPSEGLYDESQIRKIRLYFPQTDWWTLLKENYNTQSDLPAGMTAEGMDWDTVGVRFKGHSSYTFLHNTQKMSFNISLDYLPGQPKWMGYKTLNLNNCYEDPSFLREMIYLHQIRKHIPAAKAAFVHLYLNDEYWGIYPSVQQLNQDFLKEWFLSSKGSSWRAVNPVDSIGGGTGWGDGVSALNYLGADTAVYQQYYTLKSTTLTSPWQDLVDVCDVLNNTPIDHLPDVLPAYLDIDRTLWFLAAENAFVDDDSYVHKGKMDYYAYFEPETGRLTPLEYDGNSAFTLYNVSNWTPFYHADHVNFPLLNRLLQVPAWRQRYLAHLRTINEELINPTYLHPIISDFAAFIAPHVLSDPKKIYTHTQFNNEIIKLKNFASTRYNVLKNNAEMAQQGPTILEASHWFNQTEWAQPEADQPVSIRARVSATADSIRQVTLWYATGLTGNFDAIVMYDDGLHDDLAAGDGYYGASLPAQPMGTRVRWYIEATSDNPAQSVTFMPAGAEHDVFTYEVIPEMAPEITVVLNELLASNQNDATDETGEHDDWIELYNTTAQSIDLSGYVLTDNLSDVGKWTFPSGTVIGPKDYLVLWADEDSSQGPLHCNFKLSASGERLLLLNAAGQVLDDVSFGQQNPDLSYARRPNGTGNFVIQATTFGATNDLSGIGVPQVDPVQFTLAPNPSTGDVRIIGSPILADGQWQADVLDMTGRVVATQALEHNQPVLNRGNLPSGMYIVVVRQAAQVVARLKWMAE